MPNSHGLTFEPGPYGGVASGLSALMPHRVHEILLVSSAYDAFILSEDGQLSERLSAGFRALHLSAPPRVTQVESARLALQVMASRRFDMVLLGLGLNDAKVSEFAAQVKARHHDIPVVLLTFGEADIEHTPGGIDPEVIDRVFLWTGDAQILVAIIKLIEDWKNVDHDTSNSGVQVILVVEDSVRRYSTFLSLLYTEILEQSRAMSAEGLNERHKRLRMRTRPKILLATDWEEAMALAAAYGEQLMALITDVDFPRDGEIVSAGFDLVGRLRANDPRLPVLMQSADESNRDRACEEGLRWAHKTSPNLLATLRGFLRLELGFGDFVFRTPDDREWGRARNVMELEQLVKTVPVNSLRYHAAGDHFSTWLNTRGMFRLARRLRPTGLEDFATMDAVRAFLVETLREARHADQRGRIADLSAYAEGSELMRVGQGSLGGKGRGVAFLHALLARSDWKDQFDGLQIDVPRTVVIGTGEFGRFLGQHPPPPALLSSGKDEAILQWFLAHPLPDDLCRSLRSVLATLDGPLAVRSSSLLEDSRFQPFAGVYDTWMLPNNDADLEVRLDQLCEAIRAVWASTWFSASRAYFRSTPQSVEEERMGIVIQQVVGRRHGVRFYPDIAGVGQSRNYYPLPDQAPEDGVVLMAVGLGHSVVSGGPVFRFSPRHPKNTQTWHTASEQARASQSKVRVLSMTRRVDFSAGCESNLDWIDLSEAEADGTLRAAASVYAPGDDMIRDDLSRPGPRVITFNNILRWEAFPLAQALEATLQRLRRAMAGDVEIEFAVDLGDWGKRVRRGQPRQPPRLVLLQARHMASQYHGESVIDLDTVAPKKLVCRSATSLGDGLIEGICDVVWVPAEDLTGQITPEVAREVSALNGQLLAEGRPYVLIGPGRWGTSDPSLGIPVQWGDINGARVIIETPFGTRAVDPSQGTHFFHNITSLGVGYLTVGASHTADWDQLDRDWLEGQPVEAQGPYVKHLRLERGVVVHLQGKRGRAAVLKPPPPEDALPSDTQPPWGSG